MKNHVKLFALVISSLSAAFLSGCGGHGMGSVTVRSASTATSTAVVMDLANSVNASPPIDFKVCVRRIRLENDNDEPETNKQEEGADDDNYVEFSPGLLDLTDGQPKDWGQAHVPVGFKLKRLKIKVQKHEQLCGVDYSLKYGNLTANRDLEFRWSFKPEVELKDGATIKLALDHALAAIRAAAATGSLNKVKDYLDQAEDDDATAED